MNWWGHSPQRASMPFGQPWFGFAFPLLFVAAVWALVWKGSALWKAARLGQRNWFVALLVITTLGILEILYLYVFSKKSGPVSMA